MSQSGPKSHTEAVLILAPLLEDEAALGEVVAGEGERGLPVRETSLETVLEAGAGCLILTEDMLTPDLLRTLSGWAAAQPAWSALPVLVLTRNTAMLPYPLPGFFPAGHPPGMQVTLLHRPAAPEVMAMAVRNAMDSRRRQYQIRDQMEALEASHKQVVLLGREVQHRAKNSLTKISAILRQTWRSAKSPEQFIESLERRIGATARGLDLMSETHWRGAGLADLFGTEARAVFGEHYGSRLDCKGEDVALNAEAALALHLAAHELTTNALKYGAFSNQQGRVRVFWRRIKEGGEEQLDLLWEEQGGPAVSTPGEKGFGSRFVEQALALQVGGHVQMSYKPDGLHCRMVMPLANISRDKPR